MINPNLKKTYFICIFLSFIFILNSKSQLPQLRKNSLVSVIASMTLEEKAALVVGGEEYIRGYPAVFGGPDTLFGKLPTGVGDTRQYVPGAAGYTFAIPRLGITPMVFADGPAGVRIDPIRQNDPKTYYTTAFPIATLLASTWDDNLVYSVGSAMGKEALEYGIDVLLAPALNIQRNPLGGRNFEYYSEDPILSGKMASAMVKGIQNNGVGACIKHFAANNNETNRMNINNLIDEKTLREIYLRGFEIALKEGKPWTVMSAYNKINGTYCSENSWLLTDYLRKEVGFKGTVMTDWFAGRDQVQQVIAGNDLLMPGSKYIANMIVKAVREKRLNEKLLDRNVAAILTVVLKSPRFRKYKFSDNPDLTAHAQIARESARDGMVLLKNDSNSLPLVSTIKSIALFGNASYNTVSGGSGSGDVNKKYNSNIFEALKANNYKIDSELEHNYLDYLKFAKDTLKSAGWLKRENLITEYSPSDQLIRQSVVNTDCAIFTISRRSGEFNDRLLSTFSLSRTELNLLKNVSESYHANGKKVIVLLNIGAPIDVSSWANLADAVLLIWQPGQEGGNALCTILSGQTSPSGKLACTFPLQYADLPNASTFPGNMAKNINVAAYNEGLNVGYRFFTNFNQPIAYPFGYGLSYTDFKYSEPSIKEDSTEYHFYIRITNSGSVAGKEVVQLYVSAPKVSLDKPYLELKGYSKTNELKPGQSEIVQIDVKKDYLASYYPDIKRWIISKGEYRCFFASSINEKKSEIVFVK